MKKAIVMAAAIVAITATASFADEYVNGYVRDNGTYVQPHYRSSPNSSTQDNYSSKGNTNPYTSERGTRDDDSNTGLYKPNKNTGLNRRY